MPLFYREPVHIVRGEGVAVFDSNGRRYVDMHNNVPCVGHCHPHVVAAISEQVATLNVHSRYLHEGILDYAERLADHHHNGIESVVFTCTGTEANEVALMMARAATGAAGFDAKIGTVDDCFGHIHYCSCWRSAGRGPAARLVARSNQSSAEASL